MKAEKCATMELQTTGPGESWVSDAADKHL